MQIISERQKLPTLNVLQLSQLKKKTRKLCAIALLDSTLTALATFVIIQRLSLSQPYPLLYLLLRLRIAADNFFFR